MKRLSFVYRRLLGASFGLVSLLALSPVTLGDTSTITATSGQTGSTSSASAVVGHGPGSIPIGIGGVGSNSNSSGSSPDTDGDGMPDDWENNNGTDPNNADGGADYDDDGLTNAQEQEYSTYPWNKYSDADAKTDGEDGWALDKDMEPSRLPDAGYVVIEIGNGVTSVLDMNNKGELLVIKQVGFDPAEYGIWKAGTVTWLSTDAGGSHRPTDVPIAWHSMNDSGTVVGSRMFDHLTVPRPWAEFVDDGDIYKIVAGGSPEFVFGHYIPGESSGSGSSSQADPGFGWTGGVRIDASGTIYAFADGGSGGAYVFGPVKFVNGSPTPMAGFRAGTGAYLSPVTWSPAENPSHELMGVEGMNSEGIVIGGMNSSASTTGIIDNGTLIPLDSLGGTGSNAGAISDGPEPFLSGTSGGQFVIWQKKAGVWKKVYSGAEKGSQISGNATGVNERGELVGDFTGPDGTTGTIVRNGKVVDASKFPEGYTFSVDYSVGRRITKDGVAVVNGSDGGGMARSSGGGSDTPKLLRPIKIKIAPAGIQDGNETFSDLDASNSKVVVGQKIVLKCEVPEPLVVNSYEWEIGGETIKKITVASGQASCMVEELQEADKKNQVIRFYWISKGSENSVKCKIKTSNNQEVTTSVNLDLKTPNIQTASSKIVGVVRKNVSPPMFGLLGVSDDLNGIDLTADIRDPSGFSGGRFGWVQLVKTDREREFANGTVQHWKFNGTVCLDTSAPYQGTWDSSTGGVTNHHDAPADELGVINLKRLEIGAEEFTDYLMYWPSGNQSLPVPLKKQTWHWGGKAVLDANGVWQVSNATATIDSALTATAEYPEWSQKATASPNPWQ